MRVNFSKMHGLGNDFMVVDNREGKINFVESQLKSLADRRTGIGFDQVLVVESPSSSDVEFNYRIFNADCLLYTSPSPRDATLSRMPSSA